MGGFSNLLASLGWFFWWVVWFFCGPRGSGTGLGLDLGLVPVGLSIWFWFGPHSPPSVWFILFGSGSAAGLLGSLGCNIFLMVNWKCSGAPRSLRVVLRQVAILPAAAASVLSVRNGMPQFCIQAMSHVHFLHNIFAYIYISHNYKMYNFSGPVFLSFW